jgi:hypothetical protein
MPIIFTPEQIENLKLWKNQLQGDQGKEWMDSDAEAEGKIQYLLSKTNFKDGNDLSADEIDEFFRVIKTFARNRNLTNLLYTHIGLKEFNRLLRNLYYGEEKFAKRIDDFFLVKGIGTQTLSQFLVAFDPQKFPFITSQTKEILNLEAQQVESARNEAIARFEIQDPSPYLEWTTNFLSDIIIFESARSETGLTNYTDLNTLLWIGKISTEEDTGLPIQFTSLSLEKDLGAYLESNPSLIEKGLTVIQREFDTKEAGRIDLLCKDKYGNHVVVELKKGRKSDEVVGQILRYMGWVIKNRKGKVRGIIIVNEVDDRLNYAIIPLKDMIEIKYYKVRFEISNEYTPN